MPLVQVWDTTRTSREIEVTLPLFRKKSFEVSESQPDSMTYTRVDAHENPPLVRQTIITIHQPDWHPSDGELSAEVHIQDGVGFELNCDTTDEALGIGCFACTPQEFAAAVEKVRAALEVPAIAVAE